MRTLRPDQARRVALGAQGFSQPRPAGAVDVRHLRRVLDTTHVVQLDSVNVLARAHQLPFFSRLGPYPTQRLDRFLWLDREAFEYVGHAASVMPMRLHPLMRHRMRDRGAAITELEREHPGYLERTLQRVREEGPITGSDLDDEGGRGGTWWDWGSGRLALEHLYLRGDLAIHHRDQQFTLHYDLAERVIPEEVRIRADVPREEAIDELVVLAARAHGVGTSADLADYWRLRLRPARAALERLVGSGRVEEVAVRGWDQPAYVHPEATLPREIVGARLVSPFDPVVWFRERNERLFGFHYRIEIYVPERRRRYGYYVLPFLLGDRIVGRVDLKADRSRRRLLVPGAFAEEGADPVSVAAALADELRILARWLGLEDVEIGQRGDLTRPLREAIG